MELSKISLSNPQGLEYILRRPLETITFTSPEGIFDAMKTAKQKVTVHLYPIGLPSRRKQRRLIDYNRWSYHQLYLALQGDKILACVGHGDTSMARQYHNNLIDLFLQNKDLRKGVPTAVLAVFRGSVLAGYFHKSYAYSNHDVGWNWDRSITDRLNASRLPYSFRAGLFPKCEIWFRSKKRILVYHAQTAEGV